MRKLLFSTLFVVLSLIMILVLRAFMPKYSGMLLFFFVFLLFDGYLWLSVHPWVKGLRTGWRMFVTLLFWLPLTLMVCLSICILFIPFIDWNLPLRTYLQSFILMLFLAKVFPILLLVMADLIRLIRFLKGLAKPATVTRCNSIPRSGCVLKTGWYISLVLFTTMLAGTIFWQFDFNIRRQTIRLPDLPKSFDGFTIVQFSDVHLGSWGVKQRLLGAMNEINNLHPDVIFFTGDMFNFCTADGDGFEEILKTLHAPCGVYAIMGNHDYGDYISWPSVSSKKKNVDDLVQFYQNLGWKLMRNTHDIIKKGTDSIAVIGVENWGSSRRFQRFGDIEKAQQGTENMGVQLLLSHDPSHWDSIVSRKYRNIDVTFAGHTHGGQVGIDCCGFHWSPVKWISKYWCGLYQNPALGPPQYLYVNQGLGNIGYSGRIGILPEITFITLTKN